MGKLSMEAGNPSFLLNGQTLRLPRLVEADPRGRQIPRTLTTRTRPLWQGSDTEVETLLRRRGPRLLALRLDVDAEAFGALIFGPGHRARLLMLDHKEAVSAFLLALTKPSE